MYSHIVRTHDIIFVKGFRFKYVVIIIITINVGANNRDRINCFFFFTDIGNYSFL